MARLDRPGGGQAGARAGAGGGAFVSLLQLGLPKYTVTLLTQHTAHTPQGSTPPGAHNGGSSSSSSCATAGMVSHLEAARVAAEFRCVAAEASGGMLSPEPGRAEPARPWHLVQGRMHACMHQCMSTFCIDVCQRSLATYVNTLYKLFLPALPCPALRCRALAAGPSAPSPPSYGPWRPFPAPLICNTRLTATSHFQVCRVLGLGPLPAACGLRV